MHSLADMIQTVVTTFATGHASDFARSAQWMRARERYAQLSLDLIVNGHDALAGRVDREYQALRDALRAAVDSPKGRSVTDDYALWEAATEFQFTVKHLERWNRQIAAESHVEPARELPKPRDAAHPPKRSWTQDDLDEAIRAYKARRSASYRQFVCLLDDPKTSAGRKRTARKEASAIFGRNVIARALGVKSAKMVSQSQPWIAMAAELGLPRRRGEGTGSHRRKRVGAEVAVEQASVHAPDTADHAPSDAGILRAEREETLRRIRRLAESELPDAKSNAKALYDRYEAGEMTDDQIRQTVDLLIGSADPDGD